RTAFHLQSINCADADQRRRLSRRLRGVVQGRDLAVWALFEAPGPSGTWLRFVAAARGPGTHGSWAALDRPFVAVAAASSAVASAQRVVAASSAARASAPTLPPVPPSHAASGASPARRSR